MTLFLTNVKERMKKLLDTFFNFCFFVDQTFFQVVRVEIKNESSSGSSFLTAFGLCVIFVGGGSMKVYHTQTFPLDRAEEEFFKRFKWNQLMYSISSTGDVIIPYFRSLPSTPH